jgi:hypothetical protein
MRALPVFPVTPLLGSLGLHGALVLVLLLVVRRPLELVTTPRERPDAWAGNAVEVDAVATPDGVPNIPNAESPLSASPAPLEAAPAEAAKPTEAALPPPAKTDADVLPTPKRIRRAPRRSDADTAARPASASAAPSNADADHKPATQAATGAFGSNDLPPGVRSLPSAFTRAIPPATGADPLWQTLPAGKQPQFTVAVRVDADGHIQDSKILEDHDGNQPPEQFVHLRERVMALLGAGLFALQNDVSAGYGVFRISITLSDRAVREEDAPAELVERGFDPPRGSQAGRAYFTLASGRHFEAKVEILNAQHAR